ncbi:P-loop NTPase fold protein [Chitinophaga sp. Hz27]|uniref:P-loop NTPase fold protein n=1 Tax=Chitinophaga sp. Hz27 TaxID=3347169 RepID=UPI0035DC5AF3
MALLEKLIVPHKIDILIPPTQADVAIVPISKDGEPGELNEFVMKAYGYSMNKLPGDRQLFHGFGAVNDHNKKPIIFVVTVGGRSTKINLERNLYDALVEFKGWYRDRTLWLPLLGTGVGGLTIEESYEITVRILNRVYDEYDIDARILLSLPDAPASLSLLPTVKLGTGNLNHVYPNFSGRFYLVGASWIEGGSQTKRFINRSIWESEFDAAAYADSNIIKEVSEGDILILKTNISTRAGTGLIMHAIGCVTRNDRNGRTLVIDWILPDVNVMISEFPIYGDIITEVDSDDLPTIFSQLSDADISRLFSNSSNTAFRKIEDSIAGLISDSDAGTDYLNIDQDVNAFAKVIAARSFEPPFAVALLGRWGAGKSFFMRQLSDRIKFLSENGGNMYCEGIAPIRFNAWSYSDTNLWAGIVTKIFEGLKEHISKADLPTHFKKDFEIKLSGELGCTKEAVDALKDKKKITNERVQDLESKQHDAGKRLARKIAVIRKHTLLHFIKTADTQFDAKTKIEDALWKNKTFVDTEEELKTIIPEEYWSNPEEVYRQLKTKRAFLRKFFNKKAIWRNLGWLSAIIIVVVLGPAFVTLVEQEVWKFDFSLSQRVISGIAALVLLVNQMVTVINQFKPAIAALWKVKEDHEHSMMQAKEQYELYDKKLQAEIEEARAKINQYNNELKEAQTKVLELDFKIKHALSTETLYTFIDHRAKSEDYKKHLGIISIIRQDFEILNGLFTDHTKEVKNLTAAYTAKIFRQTYGRALNRIVLYIDDLDRCSEEHVVQVLEAVNLLMAFPLFVVVVGIDTRWVKNALRKKYGNQFDKQDGEEHADLLDPAIYLEKIFQIPFRLKEAADKEVKGMIQELAINKSSENMPLQPVNQNVEEASISFVENIETIQREFQTNGQQAVVHDHSEAQFSTKYVDDTRLLVFSETEVKVMMDMSKVVGNIPRTIKRYVNIFRIIKAHGELGNNADAIEEELPMILFLLALPLGKFRSLTAAFDRHIRSSAGNDISMRDFFKSNGEGNTITVLKIELKVVLEAMDSSKILLNSSVAKYKKHLDFIRRFSLDIH